MFFGGRWYSANELEAARKPRVLKKEAPPQNYQKLTRASSHRSLAIQQQDSERKKHAEKEEEYRVALEGSPKSKRSPTSSTRSPKRSPQSRPSSGVSEVAKTNTAKATPKVTKKKPKSAGSRLTGIEVPPDRGEDMRKSRRSFYFAIGNALAESVDGSLPPDVEENLGFEWMGEGIDPTTRQVMAGLHSNDISKGFSPHSPFRRELRHSFTHTPTAKVAGYATKSPIHPNSRHSMSTTSYSRPASAMDMSSSGKAQHASSSSGFGSFSFIDTPIDRSSELMSTDIVIEPDRALRSKGKGGRMSGKKRGKKGGENNLSSTPSTTHHEMVEEWDKGVVGNEESEEEGGESGKEGRGEEEKETGERHSAKGEEDGGSEEHPGISSEHYDVTSVSTEKTHNGKEAEADNKKGEDSTREPRHSMDTSSGRFFMASVAGMEQRRRRDKALGPEVGSPYKSSPWCLPLWHKQELATDPRIKGARKKEKQASASTYGVGGGSRPLSPGDALAYSGAAITSFVMPSFSMSTKYEQRPKSASTVMSASQLKKGRKKGKKSVSEQQRPRPRPHSVEHGSEHINRSRDGSERLSKGDRRSHHSDASDELVLDPPLLSIDTKNV
mmetsp:Transcript_16274/g.41241  ORF Transcript_16274/g.41241 Transcript_16274/m.41241 type:complete len:611 (-) Transcript_16274:262-2094(-)